MPPGDHIFTAGLHSRPITYWYAVETSPLFTSLFITPHSFITMPALGVEAAFENSLKNDAATTAYVSSNASRADIVTIRTLYTETLEVEEGSSISSNLPTPALIAIVVNCGLVATVLFVYVVLWLSRRSKSQIAGSKPPTTPESIVSSFEDASKSQTSPTAQTEEERESMSVIDVCANHYTMREPGEQPHHSSSSSSSTSSHYSTNTSVERAISTSWRGRRSYPLPATPPPLYRPPSSPEMSRGRRQRRPRTRRIARDGGVRLEEGDGVPSTYRTRMRTRSVATIASGMTGHSASESTNTLPPPYGRCDTPEGSQPGH